jgi:hypothetical protein
MVEDMLQDLGLIVPINRQDTARSAERRRRWPMSMSRVAEDMMKNRNDEDQSSGGMANGRDAAIR